MMRFTRFALVLILVGASCLSFSRLAEAIEIQQLKSPSGIDFWMVEDYTVPIISLSWEFKGGAAQDPDGKEGLGSILASMMDEGAGDFDAAALKAELEERGIEMSFSAGRDALGGGMRMLADERGKAFGLLGTVLNAPRFEQASLERIKASLISSLTRQENQPRAIAGRKLSQLLFGEHPYSKPRRGTLETIPEIQREDVVDQHRAIISRSSVVLGLVGAIDPAEAGVLIDLAFGDLPDQARLTPIPEADLRFGAREKIDFDGPQTIVTVALPGLKRADPEFFAGYLVTHILGGGTFSSRLYEEIREQRGLVYGVGMDLRTFDHAAYTAGGFQTSPGQAEKATAILLEEIDRMANEGPSMAELDQAKRYVTGSYAINNLDTSRKIADVLVGLQTADLGIGYINERAEKIDAVTIEDAKRAAQILFEAEPLVVTIGPAGS